MGERDFSRRDFGGRDSGEPDYSRDQRALFETEVAPHYELVTAPGCAAEEYPLTAFGHHDLAIYERTLPWDHAAGCLFLNEAGGVAARPDCSAYLVNALVPASPEIEITTQQRDPRQREIRVGFRR